MSAKLEVRLAGDKRREAGSPQAGVSDPDASAARKTSRASEDERDELGLALDALKSGYLEKARELYMGVRPCVARAIGLAFLRRVEAGEELLARATRRRPKGSPAAPSVAPDRLTGVLLAPWTEGKCSRALIMFGGNADRVFPIPKPLLKTPSHVIVIRDPSRCFGMCEIPRIGADYDTNLGILRRVLARLGATETFCVGFSSGGFPALKFGLDLRAQGVMAFSSPTSLDIADDPGSDLSKYPQLALIYRKARQRATSMAREYSRSAQHPRVLLVFGKGHARDTFCANLMAHVRGVRLKALQGFTGHTSFAESISRGAFSGFLTELFALTPIVNRAPRASRAAAAGTAETNARATEAPGGETASAPPSRGQ